MSQGYLKGYPRCSSMSLHTVPSDCIHHVCSFVRFHNSSLSSSHHKNFAVLFYFMLIPCHLYWPNTSNILCARWARAWLLSTGRLGPGMCLWLAEVSKTWSPIGRNRPDAWCISWPTALSEILVWREFHLTGTSHTPELWAIHERMSNAYIQPLHHRHVTHSTRIMSDTYNL